MNSKIFRHTSICAGAAVIHFVIPIKNPSRIADKDLFKANLSRTLSSISRQAGKNKIWLVLSEGTPIPALPPNAKVIVVPPSDDSKLNPQNKQDFYAFVRRDKGRRVLEAFKKITNLNDYLMVVDDDDIIHADLAGHIKKTESADTVGYYVKHGYGYPSGGDAVYEINDFHKICGTSLIIRAKYFLYHNAALNPKMDGIIDELGSHVLSPGRLARWNLRLNPLPFHAAIYRVHNQNSTQSESRKLISGVATTESALKDASKALVKITPEIREKFWGNSALS